ncbi:hypothetical protein [Streptomyces sp. NRRL F-5123]|uniref:hypothetical protein n=1 Tax=Streptomyces sp. NRRL F-5123 TaxID=1463856 RepID=UPI0004E17BD7|nr:hypothetical protein [Streptomyces sp. NRRL F-5123]
MRVRITTTLTVAAAVMAGSALLTACNDDSGDSSDTTSSPSATAPATTDAPTTDAPAPTDSATDAGGDTAAQGKPVPVNKSFADDVMGEKATVISYISGFQPSAASKSKFSALEDEYVVLVNVKVTASSKYYDTFGAGSFYLTNQSNGIDQASTTILDDDIKAAGYTPLEDAETGKSTTGWVVFTPKKDETALVLRYKRLAANASDGTKITAKNFDIPLK